MQKIISSEKVASVEVRIVHLDDGEYRVETVQSFGDWPLEWECREDETKLICASYSPTLDAAQAELAQKIDFERRINNIA